MSKFVISDLSLEEVNTILAGLLELPGKFGLNVINKVRTQVEGQAAAQPSIEGSDGVEASEKTIN